MQQSIFIIYVTLWVSLHELTFTLKINVYCCEYCQGIINQESLGRVHHLIFPDIMKIRASVIKKKIPGKISNYQLIPHDSYRCFCSCNTMHIFLTWLKLRTAHIHNVYTQFELTF